MPGRNNGYFRRYRNNTEDNPLLDLVGFKGQNRSNEEKSVRNMRQTVARSMDKDGADLDAVSAMLGKAASIVVPSLASLKQAAIDGLTAARTSRSTKAINDAIAAIRAPQVQELHLLPFDPDFDGEFPYQASDDDTQYYVVMRRGFIDPETGRPAMPSTGKICRVLTSVGDDPRNTGNNRRGPSGSQIRHQDWRQQVTDEGFLTSACMINTFRITGVNHVLAANGSRTEAELVFYVEAYSAWTDGVSKLLVPFPSTGGEQSKESDQEMDGPEEQIDTHFGDDDLDPLS